MSPVRRPVRRRTVLTFSRETCSFVFVGGNVALDSSVALWFVFIRNTPWLMIQMLCKPIIKNKDLVETSKK